MAKTIRFPLEMDDGKEVRTLDELRNSFSLERVLAYLEDGKLITWLKARYADDIAESLEAIAKDDPELPKKVCEIFGVEYDESSAADMEKAAEHNRKLALLKDFTDDKKYLDVVDSVAFDQDDLYDLLDEGVTTIYLCGEKFSIPTGKNGITYIGINKPIAVIDSVKLVDFDSKSIVLENVEYDEKYRKLMDVNNKAIVPTRSGINISSINHHGRTTIPSIADLYNYADTEMRYVYRPTSHRTIGGDKLDIFKAMFPTMKDMIDNLDLDIARSLNLNFDPEKGHNTTYVEYILCILAKMFGYTRELVEAAYPASTAYWDIAIPMFLAVQPDDINYSNQRSGANIMANNIFNHHGRTTIPSIAELYNYADTEMRYVYWPTSHTPNGGKLDDTFKAMFPTMKDMIDNLDLDIARSLNLKFDPEKGHNTTYVEYVLCILAKMFGYTREQVEAAYPASTAYWDIAVPTFMIVHYIETNNAISNVKITNELKMMNELYAYAMMSYEYITHPENYPDEVKKYGDLPSINRCAQSYPYWADKILLGEATNVSLYQDFIYSWLLKSNNLSYNSAGEKSPDGGKEPITWDYVNIATAPKVPENQPNVLIPVRN